MLVEFTISNFTSFKDEVYFSMEPSSRVKRFPNAVLKIGKGKKQLRLLKQAVIFGANASGKTNFLMAFLTLRSVILSNLDSNRESLFYFPFGKSEKPTKFSIKFIYDSKLYDYQIEYDDTEVLFEYLREDEKVIFERTIDGVRQFPKILETEIDRLRRNQTLLWFAQHNNVTSAENAFNWFYDNVVFLGQHRSNSAFALLEDNQYKEKFLFLLAAADLNVIDVDVVRNKKVADGMSASTDEKDSESNYFVLFTHRGKESDYKVLLQRESQGTQILASLALTLLKHMNKGKLLLIDEFDRSFHLGLSKMLVEVFNRSEQHNQIVVTTHSADLMDCRLRRDQIWFLDKNYHGESDLYSLCDFSDVRSSASGYAKEYLDGAFRAIPLLNDSLFFDVLERE